MTNVQLTWAPDAYQYIHSTEVTSICSGQYKGRFEALGIMSHQAHWGIMCGVWRLWFMVTPSQPWANLQYIPRYMHTVFALLCFVVVIHWLIFPYPSGLLHWHCGNLTIAPVPAKQPWWIWINTSCEVIMNDCITTTKQSTTKPCAYFLGYTVPGLCYMSWLSGSQTIGAVKWLYGPCMIVPHKWTKIC